MRRARACFAARRCGYYLGVSKMQELERLTIAGARLLLLEMPFTKWTDYAVKELIELTHARGLQVVLAHVERYLPFVRESTLVHLRENGILMQANAAFFEGFFQGRRALRLLGAGLIHFLGSDAHNMTTRPPCLSGAYERIEKTFGSDFVSQMKEFGARRLGKVD